MSTPLHRSLPVMLAGYELSQWLRANSVESFDDEVKHFFKPDEIAEFEHESSAKGREMNRLNAILKEVSEAIKKGIVEDLTIEIPASLGVKMLETQRRQNDDFIEKGYEIEEARIYGVVDTESETMEYFMEDGSHVKERSRELTPKEKMKHLSTANIMKMAANG